MIHPDILAALARKRVNAFLSGAQAARQASLARAARSRVRGKRLILRDGSTVLIRPVRSTDAPLLADGFARLSPQSRWMRFLGTKTSLSAADRPDQHRRPVTQDEALAADPGPGCAGQAGLACGLGSAQEGVDPLARQRGQDIGMDHREPPLRDSPVDGLVVVLSAAGRAAKASVASTDCRDCVSATAPTPADAVISSP
jgi:hypothetical protein